MIHRHKHEMTLKFPSIKNDNMLSGELRTPSAEFTESARVQVCAWVIHDQTDTLISHFRKLNGTAMLVVYDNVNHTAQLSVNQRSLF